MLESPYGTWAEPLRNYPRNHEPKSSGSRSGSRSPYVSLIRIAGNHSINNARRQSLSAAELFSKECCSSGSLPIALDGGAVVYPTHEGRTNRRRRQGHRHPVHERTRTPMRRSGARRSRIRWGGSSPMCRKVNNGADLARAVHVGRSRWASERAPQQHHLTGRIGKR